MNEKTRQILMAVTEAPAAWRGIFKDWEGLDDELRDHYSRDAAWLLMTARRMLAKVPEGDEDWAKLRPAVMVADAKLLGMSDEIQRFFGFEPDPVAPPSAAWAVSAYSQAGRVLVSISAASTSSSTTRVSGVGGSVPTGTVRSTGPTTTITRGAREA
jgi:hypothetical protein